MIQYKFQIKCFFKLDIKAKPTSEVFFENAKSLKNKKDFPKFCYSNHLFYILESVKLQ